jgi:hypothetical protein
VSALTVLPSVAVRGRPPAGVSLVELIAAVVLVVVAVNLAIGALLGWVWWRDSRAARRPPTGIDRAWVQNEGDWS